MSINSGSSSDLICLPFQTVLFCSDFGVFAKNCVESLYCMKILLNLISIPFILLVEYQKFCFDFEFLHENLCWRIYVMLLIFLTQIRNIGLLMLFLLVYMLCDFGADLDCNQWSYNCMIFIFVGWWFFPPFVDV
jgi:hypothetical protein